MALWGKPDLNSDSFVRAITSIQKRAEKQTDWNKLLETYVSSDLGSRAKTIDSQLVLGRRGTGKTHLFRVLHNNLRSEGKVAFFIDCRILGSGVISSSEEPPQIASKYFRSLLNEIGTELLDMAARMEMPRDGIQQKVLNTIYGLTRQMEPSPTLDSTQPTFNYRQISESLHALITDLKVGHLLLIMDEWSQVPISAQPYFSEYVKRAIMTVPEVSVKFLALSYQCQLSIQTKDGPIGCQRGADIPDVLDFDSYLIYEENKELVTQFFSQVLYNHLGVELGWALPITSEAKTSRITDLFTQGNALVELVRAAEGNCRDMLCIFSKAFWEGYRQQGGVQAIGVQHIREAAANWFDSEKYANIREEQIPNTTLRYIVNRIVKGYKSRTFMVEASKALHPVITRLLNERLLHKLSGFYSHQDRPGERYELFTIDYGAYVRFTGTVNEPYQTVLPYFEEVEKMNDDEKRYIVPLDDKRSIRRIVFDPDALVITT